MPIPRSRLPKLPPWQVAFDGKEDSVIFALSARSADRRTVAVYDIKKVLDGKVPDPILEPNDIVYLPPVPLKQFITSGGLGTVLGLVDFALIFR